MVNEGRTESITEALSLSSSGYPKRAAIYARARVPDDNPCPLASHGLDQVKLHREARPAYTRLSIHELTFLSINLHDPTHDTTNFNVAVRPPIAAHS